MNLEYRTRWIAMVTLVATVAVTVVALAWPAASAPHPMEAKLLRKEPAAKVKRRNLGANAERAGSDLRGAKANVQAIAALYQEHHEIIAGHGQLEPVGAGQRAQGPQAEQGASSKTRRWVLFREPSRVEMRWLDTALAEIWTRADNGSLGHTKAFLNEGAAITYTQGDLASLQIRANWYQLSRLIDAPVDELGLKAEGLMASDWGDAIHYTGQHGGHQVELYWLDEYQLPALIETTKGLRRSVVRLDALHPIDASPWKRSGVRTLREIEFSDLGDRETDPLVIRLEHRYPNLHAHGGHEH